MKEKFELLMKNYAAKMSNSNVVVPPNISIEANADIETAFNYLNRDQYNSLKEGIYWYMVNTIDLLFFYTIHNINIFSIVLI